jgi:uncharacterized protein YbjQ (UPF0145 family)
MRTMAVLALVLMMGCDAEATGQHAQVPQTGTTPEGSGGSASAGGANGVSGGQILPQSDPARGTPAEAARVQVLYLGTEPKEATEVLGVVDVHEPGNNEQQGLEIMRERAAAMHADAVIGVEFHRDDKNFTDLSGLAVRYNDLLRNRDYDVLEVIRVHEGEGKDGDAMGELRRRASNLHADLIINVAWHDNDAEKDGTYLTGTAIRYRKESL